MSKLVLKEIKNQRPDNEVLQILQKVTKKIECDSDEAGMYYKDPITKKLYFFKTNDVPPKIYEQISAHIYVTIPNAIDYYISK